MTWVKATAAGALCAAGEALGAAAKSEEESGGTGAREAANIEPLKTTAPSVTAVIVFIWEFPCRHPTLTSGLNLEEMGGEGKGAWGGLVPS